MNLPQESLLRIFCSKTDYNVDSKHNIILSSFKLPYIGQSETNQDNHITAPTVPNTKHRILWDEDNLLQYQELIMEPLQELQKNWSNPETPVSFSILLQCTNRILSDAAKASNKYVDLSKKTRVKKTCIPAEVTAAAKAKKVAHTILKNTPENALEGEKAVARVNFDNARKTHRNLWRRHLAATDNAQDSELHTILSTNPQAAHRVLNSAKSSGSTSISELKVANKVYRNDKICDGFFENIQ